MRTASHTSDVIRPWPLVALGGWVLPGLGHVLAGHTRRGVIVGVTLLLLFTAGLLIGGIDVVDRKNDTLWFAGQALLGPVALGADYAHRRLDDARDAQVAGYARGHNLSDEQALNALREEGTVAYRTSVGRVNELGTLYATLAGVMNLLVILDAVGKASEASRFPFGRSKPAGAKAGGVEP